MMYWNGNHMSGWAFGLMTAGMVVFWALVVIGIFLLVRYLIDSGHRTTTSSPEQVLAERFARGEIDADEYQSRLSALHHAKS